MIQLALKIPSFNEPVPTPSGLRPEFTNLTSFINPLLVIVFYVAGFLAFYFLIWGAFQYIVASGDKEQLQKARTRITWAILGLSFIFLAYFVAQYASEIFAPGVGGSPFK